MFSLAVNDPEENVLFQLNHWCYVPGVAIPLLPYCHGRACLLVLALLPLGYSLTGIAASIHVSCGYHSTYTWTGIADNVSFPSPMEYSNPEFTIELKQLVQGVFHYSFFQTEKIIITALGLTET